MERNVLHIAIVPLSIYPLHSSIVGVLGFPLPSRRLFDLNTVDICLNFSPCFSWYPSLNQFVHGRFFVRHDKPPRDLCHQMLGETGRVNGQNAFHRRNSNRLDRHATSHPSSATNLHLPGHFFARAAPLRPVSTSLHNNLVNDLPEHAIEFRV